LTDPANPRIVTFGYDPTAAEMGNKPVLRSVTDAMNQVYRFRWSAVVSGGTTYYDNLVKMEKPKGAAWFDVENTWDYITYKNAQGEGRYGIKVVGQKDPYNNQTTFSYNYTPYYTEETRPDGGIMKFHHNNAHVPPSQFDDPTGKSIRFTKDTHNRVTSVTDRMNDTTSVAYHETGKIASITNNKGDIITYNYTAQDQTFADPDTPANTVAFTFYNLTRVDYPDGTNAQFVYDANGNITQKTDRNAQTRNYQYNGRGQVTQITNPANGVTTFTYNADATLASSTNSDTGVTTYQYDAYKRLTKITHPDGTFVQTAYNLNNQVTSVTDETGKIYAYTYDTNGNLISTTDPNNKVSQYAHDLMDRVNEITNRRGQKSQLAYDNMNRLQSSTDANGNQTKYTYNSRDWLNQITDPGNKHWTTTYDDEGLISAMTTPLNRTTNIGRDKLGFVTSITDPLGNNATLTRDTLSRITQTTDPVNRQTSYGYDNRGLLTSVTLPLVGSTQYTRNNLGLLSHITDLNNKSWDFIYTNMGKLSTLTDPLNQSLQYAYDQRGRLEKITYPDATTQTKTLSASGNVTAKTWSDGLDLAFTYDNLNRLTASENIEFTYNEVGQVTSTANPPASFGATYDNDGRLDTVTYADALFSVTYTYDTRSLLTQVSDNLTHTFIQFSHDDDGRLTGITRSNNQDTAFTLDAASRVSKIQHGAPGTLAEMTYTYNAAGEVTKLDYTLPLDPADFLAGKTENFTFDAASQINATGYGYDTRGRLSTSPNNAFSWDGATRLTSTANATMTYNGLGDLSTRTESGQTTRYYYNYALGLSPIVAEKDEGEGQWQRFYVLTPGGTLLYMIDAVDNNKVYCYHFDKTGNTLFLTDAAGTITDKYAYTPYGKLLAHEGSNTQPFTFVGAWQIRQEGNGIYQMRARYYDAVTARFISREPLWPRIGRPGALNPYQYAAQNPAKFVDITGTTFEDPDNDLHEFAEGNDGWKEVADLRNLVQKLQDAKDNLRSAEEILNNPDKGYDWQRGMNRQAIKRLKGEIKNLKQQLEREKANPRNKIIVVDGFGDKTTHSVIEGMIANRARSDYFPGEGSDDAPDNDLHEFSDPGPEGWGWKDVDDPPVKNHIGKRQASGKLNDLTDMDNVIKAAISGWNRRNSKISLSQDWEGSTGTLSTRTLKAQSFHLAR